MINHLSVSLTHAHAMGHFKIPLKTIKIQCYVTHYISHQLQWQVILLVNKLLTETSWPFTDNLTSKHEKKKRFCKKYKISADVWPKEKTGTYLTIHYIFYYERKNRPHHVCSQKLITPIRQTLIAITWLLGICSTYIFHPVLKQFFVLLQY